MNKICIFLISLVVSFLFLSCDDFLDTKSLTKKDSSNFPKTAEDAMQALTGIYGTLYYNVVHENMMIVPEILSDDRTGGGGDNDRKVHAINRLLKVDDNMFGNLWRYKYQGIFRANMLLETLELVEGWGSESQKAQLMGEVLYLRAFSYFDLCRTFGTVPLPPSTEAVNLPRASPEELYAYIAQDLKDAIEMMPAEKFGTSGVPALGHATKWAAEALMARVFLFYTGYYQKETIPLTGGGTVTKDNVIAWLEDCIQNSGHSLVSDFRNLWPYSNPYTVPDYSYAKNLNLTWVGEEGGNTETIFAIKFGTIKTSGAYSFSAIGDMSLRTQPDYRKTFPFGQGWGILPVTRNMYEDWVTKEPNDLRRKGSIFDVDDPEENIEYTWGCDKQVEESGYWQKKYFAINHKKEDGSVENFSIPMFGSPTGQYFVNDNIQDWVIIRFADVLLMAAELKQDVSYLNLVRIRAQLLPLPTYSLSALQDERRWELAFEGIRYYDLLRWGIAAEALQKQHGVKVKNRGEDAIMDMPNIGQRVLDTGGFMQIPQTQIDLSEGVLEQTPGWTANDVLFNGY